MDRRTSVRSGLGLCFLCFLLRGNSTASFIFSGLPAMRPLAQGPPVAQARPRTDALFFLRGPSPLASLVPWAPCLQMSYPSFPNGQEGPWTWIPGAWPPPQLCPKLASSPISQQPSLSFSFVTSVKRGRTSEPRPPLGGPGRPSRAVLTRGWRKPRPWKGSCLRDTGPLSCTSSA